MKHCYIKYRKTIKYEGEMRNSLEKTMCSPIETPTINLILDENNVETMI